MALPTVTLARAPAWSPTLRARMVWILPAAFSASWALFVVVAGHVERVADHWRAAVMMVFGSFVAGSTPQGGGAVAFPVLTKVLEVPAAVARSFSLSIQATGMVMAAVIILLAGRHVDRTALRYGVLGGSAGFLVGALLLGDRSTPFWESVLPAPYVKVSFTIAVAMVATIVFLCADREFSHTEIDGWSKRALAGVLAFAFVGGVASALTGSGVDVFLFLFVTLVAGLHPRVGIPTSIITMAVLSVLGLALHGLYDGQLHTAVVDGSVVAVGGAAIEPLSSTRADLFGIWLAAAPIVVWGAPLGAWVASVLPTKVLVGFVAVMALAELVTTIVFLDDLHHDGALIAFGAIGLVLAVAGTTWLSRSGPAAFGFVPPLAPSTAADPVVS